MVGFRIMPANPPVHPNESRARRAAASAMKPVPMTGTWAQITSDGTQSKVTVYRITVQGKQAQLEKPGKDGKGWEKSYTLSFDALGKSMYLVQAQSPGSANPNYVVMQVAPKARELQLVNPACTEAQAKDWEATRSGSDAVEELAPRGRRRRFGRRGQRAGSVSGGVHDGFRGRRGRPGRGGRAASPRAGRRDRPQARTTLTAHFL